MFCVVSPDSKSGDVLKPSTGTSSRHVSQPASRIVKVVRVCISSLVCSALPISSSAAVAPSVSMHSSSVPSVPVSGGACSRAWLLLLLTARQLHAAPGLCLFLCPSISKTSFHVNKLASCHMDFSLRALKLSFHTRSGQQHIAPDPAQDTHLTHTACKFCWLRLEFFGFYHSFLRHTIVLNLSLLVECLFLDCPRLCSCLLLCIERT